MKRIASRSNCTLALVIAGLLAAGPAASDPPGAGGGKGDKSEKSQKKDKSEKSEKGQKNDKGEKSERGDQSDNRKDQQRDRDAHTYRDGAPVPVRQYFEDRHRAVVREYYSQEFDRGRCPPGLAKKQNGCMPPGQAKKWTVGRPLPRDVIFYDLEPQLVTLFGPPPSGHRYVRVASDILLLASGSGMVVDFIQDLGRM